ncbi:unnamed protein product [Toxocara canis]|uniref:Secreted protein n=1 Tax=Toxocara canis TaxID=6265 RepID=A0A183UQ72_TOXCA|nr:unnamed protein product [Toxocara canis]
MRFCKYNVISAGVLSLTFADHWSVQDGDEVCVVLEANITGNVKYTKITNETVEYHFNVTAIDSNGECHTTRKNESVQYLQIVFLPNNITPPQEEAQQQWKLTLWFAPGHEQTFRVQDFELYAFFYKFMNSTGRFRFFHAWMSSDYQLYSASASNLLRNFRLGHTLCIFD